MVLGFRFRVLGQGFAPGDLQQLSLSSSAALARYAPPMPSEPAVTVSVEGMKFQHLRRMVSGLRVSGVGCKVSGL